VLCAALPSFAPKRTLTIASGVVRLGRRPGPDAACRPPDLSAGQARRAGRSRHGPPVVREQLHAM